MTVVIKLLYYLNNIFLQCSSASCCSTWRIYFPLVSTYSSFAKKGGKKLEKSDKKILSLVMNTAPFISCGQFKISGLDYVLRALLEMNCSLLLEFNQCQFKADSKPLSMTWHGILYQINWMTVAWLQPINLPFSSITQSKHLRKKNGEISCKLITNKFRGETLRT